MKSDKPKQKTRKSHPAVRYDRIPLVRGNIFQFESLRARILSDVVDRTYHELSQDALALSLSEAAFGERRRVQKNLRLTPGHLFIMKRTLKDQKLWKKVYRGLKNEGYDADYKILLENILWHYAEEIGGHFDPGVYRFASRAVPFGFSWLLNAISLHQFMPSKMTESLEDRLRIVGNVSHLQNLGKKGTILLVPTHQSNLDSVLVGYVISLMSLPPFSYGAGLNLFKNPVLSYFMNRLGAYTVDRDKVNAIYKKTLKNYSTRILQEGIHSVFFPGGGRSSSGAIEAYLKKGLLGTGLEAQLLNHQQNKEKPSVFVVPMVTSCHFVMEASSLIERYLQSIGGHRFLGASQDESGQLGSIIRFFWRFFSSPTEITVRVGRPMDVFGNLVDENGVSLGPNGTTIDPKKWLTTSGKLQSVPQRDDQYTRRLSKHIVNEYYLHHTVLTSHLVAFSFFRALRKKYPHLDVFRFLRLSQSQRSITYETFMQEAKLMGEQVRRASDQEELYLSEELKTMDVSEWIQDGVKHLGALHQLKPVRLRDGYVTSDDMHLLYYYRNRLSGYGFSLRGERGRPQVLRGEKDEQGFLG